MCDVVSHCVCSSWGACFGGDQWRVAMMYCRSRVSLCSYEDVSVLCFVICIMCTSVVQICRSLVFCGSCSVFLFCLAHDGIFVIFIYFMDVGFSANRSVWFLFIVWVIDILDLVVCGQICLVNFNSCIMAVGVLAGMLVIVGFCCRVMLFGIVMLLWVMLSYLKLTE